MPHAYLSPVYSTCLHCTRDLGRNDVLETLPIGRRVAFDAGQGRLWVVCRSCAKWNLVPFDTRLETIDACERIFRDTRTRFSTDHIGLARARDGMDLVRIGAPQRPEFASWRYGAQYKRRRMQTMAMAPEPPSRPPWCYRSSHTSCRSASFLLAVVSGFIWSRLRRLGR